jgi:dTDP-4-dehydrorhamnose reductase
MKVLFFGSKGWIGQQFKRYLDDNNICYITTAVRADDEIQVENEIQKHQPTHIVAFIGRTHGDGINSIDYLEQEGKLHENILDNLYAPIILTILSQKYDIHYTYLGTGCIYHTDNDATVQEDDLPNFFGSSYSVVKGFTDRLQRMFSKNTLNLRIRMPITAEEHPRNLITKIVNYKQICSMPNSMTVLTDFFPVILDMMQKNVTGTFNMVNRGVITHDEILQMYKELINARHEWIPITIDEQNKMTRSKRSNCQLCTEKLYSLYPDIPDIHTSVRKCIEKMKVCKAVI